MTLSELKIELKSELKRSKNKKRIINNNFAEAHEKTYLLHGEGMIELVHIREDVDLEHTVREGNDVASVAPYKTPRHVPAVLLGHNVQHLGPLV